MGERCSKCLEQLKIARSGPVHICKKHWHGWELDGEGGRSGSSGKCDVPFLCNRCYLVLTVENKETAGNRRRLKRKAAELEAV